MKLVFHLPNEKDIELEVGLNMTALDLDDLIREKADFFICDPNFLIYIFKGKYMPRNEPIKEWNLKDGAELSVSYTLMGG